MNPLKGLVAVLIVFAVLTALSSVPVLALFMVLNLSFGLHWQFLAFLLISPAAWSLAQSFSTVLSLRFRRAQLMSMAGIVLAIVLQLVILESRSSFENAGLAYVGPFLVAFNFAMGLVYWAIHAARVKLRIEWIFGSVR